MVLQVLLLLCSLHLIFSQSTPEVSDTFDATVKVTVKDWEGEHKGYGTWGMDPDGQMGIENYKFDHDKFDVYILQRYDMGLQYMLDPVDTKRCKSFRVNGTLPSVWGWLSSAKYLGTVGHGKETVDVWEARIGYAVMRVALQANTTTPVYLVRESRDERKTTYEFLTWNETAPPTEYFIIPTSCPQINTPSPIKNTTKVGCIDGAIIMSRAQVWVNDHVPYNQGGTYQGYREDCSGYVSMCWDSTPPGHVTQTFYQIASPINKADLQPGDCLLYAAEHVVLFGGWTNDEQTYYMGYEETQPGTGTVAQSTPYPYWYSQSDFLPYRYDQSC